VATPFAEDSRYVEASELASASVLKLTPMGTRPLSVGRIRLAQSSCFPFDDEQIGPVLSGKISSRSTRATISVDGCVKQLSSNPARRIIQTPKKCISREDDFALYLESELRLDLSRMPYPLLHTTLSLRPSPVNRPRISLKRYFAWGIGHCKAESQVHMTTAGSSSIVGHSDSERHLLPDGDRRRSFLTPLTTRRILSIYPYLGGMGIIFIG
jgi:hypothetical protein